MPLFEFLCEECGARFEALVIGARVPERCPSCKSEKIEKQFSTFGLGGGIGAGSGSWRSSCGPSGGG